MDNPQIQLLAELLLDVKRDVSDMKKDISDTKEMTYSNSIVLDEHMKRSLASESRLDVQEEKLDEFIRNMEPVKDHVKAVSLLTKVAGTVLKVLSVVVAIAGTVIGLLKLK